MQKCLEEKKKIHNPKGQMYHPCEVHCLYPTLIGNDFQSAKNIMN